MPSGRVPPVSTCPSVWQACVSRRLRACPTCWSVLCYDVWSCPPCVYASVRLAGVRVAAAESLPYLLECAKIRGSDYLLEIWQYICPELLKAISSEPDSEVKSEHLYSLSKVRHFTGALGRRRQTVRRRSLAGPQ